MGKKTITKSLSILLSAAVGITGISFPAASKIAAADSAKAEVNVDSLLQVTVDGGSAKNLQLYSNGVYETAAEMEAGTHKVTLLVDGVEADTADITLSEKKTVYLRSKDGKMTDSVNDTGFYGSATLVGGFNDKLVFKKGDSTFSLGDWKQDDAKGDMSYVGGGIYKETFTLEAPGTDYEVAYGYKVAFDHAWDYSVGNNGENVTLTIPAGTTQLTVFADSINGTVGDSVNTKGYEVVQSSGTSYQAKAFEMSVSLIGPVRGQEADNWDAAKKGYEFTQISPNLFTYGKVFEKAGSYDYKAVFDYANWYEKEEGNRSFTTTSDGKYVVFLYDASTGFLYDSINNAGTIAELLGMKEAEAASEVVTNANGTAKFVLASDVKKGDEVKLVYQPVVKSGSAWGFKENSAPSSVVLKEGKDGKGEFNNSFVSDELFFGDDAVAVGYYYTINGKEYNAAKEDAAITVDGKEIGLFEREKFTGRTVNVPGTFPGKSWDAASNQMEYLGNGLYSYTFKDVPAANYEFKISMGSWDENYGQDGIKDGSNYSLALDKKQDVTVYYSDLNTHLAVTSVNYKFSKITLSGTGVAETELKDAGLTGIYSASVELAAGEYKDVKYTSDGKEYACDAFTLTGAKNVTFYFDPDTEVYYNNSSDKTVEADKVFFNTKDKAYKSTYGAVAAKAKTVFTVAAGKDVTAAKMIVKGPEAKNLDMSAKEDGDSVKWSAEVSFDKAGQYTYFFVLYAGSNVKIYCDDDGYYGEGHVTDLTDLKPYDLVVYEDGFKTPDWMKNAVIYQIFPDRFYNGDTSNDYAQKEARGSVGYEFVDNWYTIPENPEQEEMNPDTYPSNAFRGDGEWSNEMYGGDLKGITERIGYLKALGVNVIYLNPVFSSISSHRYDTSDYAEIDPILGDLGDFTELVKIAKENDMHIVLDGVFNHVSDDSIYFDRYYKFLGKDGNTSVGAYPYWAYVYDYMEENKADQATAEAAAKTYFKDTYKVTDFSYTEWFEVYQTYMEDGKVKDTIGQRAGKPVYGYEGWWGYDSMPVIASTNGSEYQTGNWAEKIIGNTPNNKDASDNITQYWLSQGSNGWRLDVANEVSDETWQNFRASVKALGSDNVIIGEIWDDATEYLLGDMYDSVMNYVFRNAVLGYAKGGSAADMMKSLEKIRERYPKEAFYAMMNLVGSHDTSRLLSYLDGIDDDRNQKDTASAFPSYETTSDTAKARQYLVAFLQMTYAGAPTIYYGDEMGQVGADDPDDRRTTPWGKGNEELVTWYAKLAAIRSNYPALRTGSIEYLDTKSDAVVGYVRSDASDTLTVLGNNAGTDTEVTVATAETGTLSDLISGKEYTVSGGKVTVKVPAYSGVILTKNAKKAAVDKEALAPAFDPSYQIGGSSAALAKVTGLTATVTGSTSAKISWKKAAGAVGYEVYRSTSKNKGFKKAASVDASKTSYKDTKLKAGKTYYYKVRAVSSGKKGSFSSVKAVKTVPKTSINKLTSGKKGTVTVTWKKASGDGYIIYTAAKKNGSYKKAKTVKKAAVTKVSFKAKSGKKCYVKVAVYCKAPGKKVAGTKSAAKNVTVK
ncbi:hypothetical protein D7V86_18790 [bacterium D16-51]|nr:hypothetical protein D7V96_05370 [bacterium D16-59]RKI56916.1 hypothetical protein D7V86_18790 [bacterium D16-51]